MGVNADEVNAIRYLTFYSTWIEDNTGRFLTLRYELNDGPWTLTIAGDDTKFALSHLCDKLGKRVEVRRWSVVVGCWPLVIHRLSSTQTRAKKLI